MKKIHGIILLKYLVLVLLNIIIIMIAINIPREIHSKYMLSFIPMYALFYGAFSRLLTKSTLLPTIILFFPFWYILGGGMLIGSLFKGIYSIESFFLSCGLPGIYCVFSLIPSLAIKGIVSLIKAFINQGTHQSGDGSVTDQKTEN